MDGAITRLGYLLTMLAMLLQACNNNERSIAETQVPSAILEDFNSNYPGADVREYVEAKEHGESVYEISFRDDGRNIDILYAHDGRVLELWELVAEEDLPVRIVTSLNAEFADYTIKEIEKKSEEGEVFYDIELYVVEDDSRDKRDVLFYEDGRKAK